MTGVDVIVDVLAALPDPAFLLDPQGRVAAVNDPARDTFGAWVEGQSYVSVLRQPALLGPVEEAFFVGVPATARFRHSTGEVDTEYEVRVAPQPKLGDGRRPAVLLVFRDVTDASLGAAMRQDFVANVSHELKTPLTSVMGFVETLRGSARDDAVARDRFLELMAQELGRMDRLVADLLSLGRVEGQVRSPPREIVDLARLVTESLDVLRPVAAAAGVRLEPSIPDRATARADRDQIIQMVLNLVENAIKYGARPGRVEIGLSYRDREPSMRRAAWTLTVSDEGRGVPAEHLPRLTERFYRIDAGRTGSHGGTGLGLSIVKHIVNRHRGRMRIDSTVGAGTTVRVTLPTSTDRPGTDPRPGS